MRLFQNKLVQGQILLDTPDIDKFKQADAILLYLNALYIQIHLTICTQDLILINKTAHTYLIVKLTCKLYAY